MIKNFFKKITGLQALEDAKAKAQEEANVAQKLAEQKAKEAADAEAAAALAKSTPKDRANARGEPWVGVLNTHVNQDNVRNGFFELDWNEHFIVQLKKAGYGFEGDPDEEIVDRWFRDLASSMFLEQGLDPRSRTAGFINVVPLTKGKSEVS